MSLTDLIILTFNEPWRGRELRPGYLPSDRLWSALFAADVALQGEPMALEHPYRVSSAFPYVAGEWLLPKPRVTAQQDRVPAPGTPSVKKQAKSLEFVRLKDFLTLAGGRPLAQLDEALAWQRRGLLPRRPEEVGIDDRQLARALKGTRFDGRADTLAREQYAAPAQQLSGNERLHLARAARSRRSGGSAERQRNTQDRLTQATDTFTTASVLQPQVAFLLRAEDERQRHRLMAALRLLADSGLGGMRTQGSGQFVFDVAAVPEGLERRLHAAGPQVLLGLTRPSPQEARDIDEAKDAQYALIRRDGYLDGTPLQRLDVWMLTEGSLVPAPLGGTLTDVAPDGHPHPVWRSGLALSVGVGE